jgi:hypothetical protein
MGSGKPFNMPIKKDKIKKKQKQVHLLTDGEDAI